MFAPELKRFGKKHLSNHISPCASSTRNIRELDLMNASLDSSSTNTVSVPLLVKTLEDEIAGTAGCVDLKYSWLLSFF